MPILLGDDGSMDTFVYCSECGREYRGNWDPSGEEDDTYGAFIDWLIEEIEAEHVCGGEGDTL